MEKSNWICGKCEQEKGKHPGVETIPEHSRHCKLRIEPLDTLPIGCSKCAFSVSHIHMMISHIKNNHPEIYDQKYEKIR